MSGGALSAGPQSQSSQPMPTLFGGSRAAPAVLVCAIVLGPAAPPASGESGGHWPGEVAAEADYSAQDHGKLRWAVAARVGSDDRLLLLRTDGERTGDSLTQAQVEVLYDKHLAGAWRAHAGVRHDFQPEALSYVALGAAGKLRSLETEAHIYLSEEGDFGTTFEAGLDLPLGSGLSVSPYLELEWFASDVPAMGAYAGCNEVTAGLRLTQEISASTSTYLNLDQTYLVDDARRAARTAGEDAEMFAVRAGVMMRF